MRTINIKCTQKVTYDQILQLTDEEYEILKDYDGSEIDNSFKGDREAYDLLVGKLDSMNIIDSEEVFRDIRYRHKA